MASRKFTVFFLFIMVFLDGCSSYYKMMRSGGAMIARIQAYDGGVASARIDLPAGGVVDLIFVFDDYGCNYPRDAFLKILKKHGNEVIDVTVAMDEITWMKKGNKCIPVGYVRDYEQGGVMPLRVKASQHAGIEVHYYFEVIGGGLAGSNVDVWAYFHGIYNVDRLIKVHQLDNKY